MARDANELVSLPVVGTDEGRELGHVCDVLFDPARQALLGLMVSSSDGPSEAVLFIDRDRIRGLGKDAVTVEGAASLQPVASQEHANAIVESGIHLKGTKVLTDGGDAIGTVDKIMLNDDGTIECYEATSGILGLGGRHDIFPNEVHTIGVDAIIVDATCADRREDNARPLAERTNPA